MRRALSRILRCLWLLLVVVLLAPPPAVRAQTPPKVLLVVAHPDDELVVAATVYRLAQELGGTVDQFVVTNGEGGYRYATLAEKVYGLELTREEVGRRELPDIRKRELLAAGKILGVRAHFFLDEPDVNNTANPNDVLDGAWKTEAVLTRLGDILAREQYGFVVTALPRDTLGGHHLAAALLTLRAVARLDEAERPVVLGAHFTPDVFQVAAADERAGFTGAPDFDFDRTRTFGFNNALDYQIVANWMIAEHKSQGLYQTNMGRSAHEYLWIFNRDVARNRERAQALFAQLAAPAGQ